MSVYHIFPVTTPPPPPHKERFLCFILVKECRIATYRYAYLKAWFQSTVFLTIHWLKWRLLLCITCNPVIVKLITSYVYALFHICFYLYTLEMLINFIFKSVEFFSSRSSIAIAFGSLAHQHKDCLASDFFSGCSTEGPGSQEEVSFHVRHRKPEHAPSPVISKLRITTV